MCEYTWVQRWSYITKSLSLSWLGLASNGSSSVARRPLSVQPEWDIVLCLTEDNLLRDDTDDFNTSLLEVVLVALPVYDEHTIDSRLLDKRRQKEQKQQQKTCVCYQII